MNCYVENAILSLLTLFVLQANYTVGSPIPGLMVPTPSGPAPTVAPATFGGYNYNNWWWLALLNKCNNNCGCQSCCNNNNCNNNCCHNNGCHNNGCHNNCCHNNCCNCNNPHHHKHRHHCHHDISCSCDCSSECSCSCSCS